MILRFAAFILLVFSLRHLSNADSPPLTIQYNFQDKEIPLSSGSRLYLWNVAGDDTRELVIQNQRTFAVYRIDLENKTLIPLQQFTIPLKPGDKGPYYYSFGSPDEQNRGSLLVLSPEGLDSFPQAREKPGFRESPEKILERQCYPSPDKPDISLRPVRFSLDMDQDGYDELILPDARSFHVLKKTGNEFQDIPLPVDIGHLSTSFDVTDTISFHTSSHSNVIFLRIGDNKTYSLLLIKDHPENREGRIFSLHHPRSPLSFSDTPDQEIILPGISQRNIFFMDLNKDGFMDILTKESNYNLLSPLTKVDVYLSPEKPKAVFQEPTQELRIGDPDGMIYFGDFSGDGLVDICAVQLAYKASSTEDFVEYFAGNHFRLILAFYLFHPTIDKYLSAPDFTLPLIMDFTTSPYRRPLLSINTQADFNGDGRKDILAWVKPDLMEIYTMTSSDRIHTKPYAKLQVSEVTNYVIGQIDQGKADDVAIYSLKKRRVTLFIFR